MALLLDAGEVAGDAGDGEGAAVEAEEAGGGVLSSPW